MGYTVTLFDGTTHTIQGEGTQEDPFIIDCIEGLTQHSMNTGYSYKGLEGYYKFADEIITIEQELPVPGDTAEKLAIKKKTIDMNRIAPQGFYNITDHPTDKSYIIEFGAEDGYSSVGGHFDGNGCTIKNWYVEVTYTGKALINFSNCELKNLNIENMYINGTKTSNSIFLLGTKNGISIKDCKFSIMTNFEIPDDTSTNNTVCGILYNTNSNNNYITNCSFNFRNIASYMEIIRVTQGGAFNGYIYNCVFRAYSPFLPYVQMSGSVADLRYRAMFQITNGVSGPTTNLYLINCRTIYETLNLNNKKVWSLSSNCATRSANIQFKNCVFELINNSDTSITNVEGYSMSTDGKSLVIYDRMGANPSVPSGFSSITHAQSIDRNYLLSLLFPLMWEDE